MKCSCMLNNVVIFCKATSDKVAVFYLLHLSSERSNVGNLPALNGLSLSRGLQPSIRLIIDHPGASLSKQHY